MSTGSDKFGGVYEDSTLRDLLAMRVYHEGELGTLLVNSSEEIYFRSDEGRRIRLPADTSTKASEVGIRPAPAVVGVNLEEDTMRIYMPYGLVILENYSIRQANRPVLEGTRRDTPRMVEIQDERVVTELTIEKLLARNGVPSPEAGGEKFPRPMRRYRAFLAKLPFEKRFRMQALPLQEQLEVLRKSLEEPEDKNNGDQPEDHEVNGYIYVLTNPEMPDVVKVGHTKRGVEKRINELSSPSGVPSSFDLAYKKGVKNPLKVEMKVFEDLSNKRVTTDREFFRVDEQEAINAIEEVTRS